MSTQHDTPTPIQQLNRKLVALYVTNPEVAQTISDRLDELERSLAASQRECERLREAMAGKLEAHAIAAFQLAEELGHGASSVPPVEIIRETIAKLRADGERLADADKVIRLLLDRLSWHRTAVPLNAQVIRDDYEALQASSKYFATRATPRPT